VASLRPKLRLPTSYPPIKGWKIAFSIIGNRISEDESN